MSALIKIKFDASIHDGCIGVGIHNFDMKTDIKHRFKFKNVPCSFGAESVALIKTLQYMKQVGIKQAHLFTDNQAIAEKGIQKSLLKGFGMVTLTWIPREFNEEADKLSKEAHQLQPAFYNAEIDKVVVANGTQMPKKEQLAVSAESVKGLNKRLRAFTPSQRISMLKKIRQNKFTESVIKTLAGESKEVLQQDYRKADRAFLSIVMATFAKEELPTTDAWKKLVKKTSITIPANQHLVTLLRENVA